MTSSWAVAHPHARALPSGRHVGAEQTLIGVREDLADEEPPITYAERNDGTCLHVLAGVRCPSRFAHDGPCGARMHSETGVTFYVTWEPIDRHIAHGGDDPKQLRARLAEVERDSALLWRLAVCRICGNAATNKADREQFLRTGAHLGCEADERHDIDVHFEAEEHFA